MTTKKIILIIILFCFSPILVTSQDIQFTDIENLPEARSALTSANNDENIFVVNGFGGNDQYTSDVFQYSVSQGSWSILTSSTIPKRFASSEVIGDFLYVFNGLTENGTLNSRVEKINLNNGMIEYLSDNPQPCKAAGVSKWDDKIYSFGGTLEPNEYSNKLYQFDPLSDIWTELTQIPFAGETKGEIVDGKLYIVGGYNGTVSNSINIYNLSSGVWESDFVMPVGISAHATAIAGRKIYLVGDFANLTSLAYFDTFDNSFHVLSNNLNPRRHCAAEGIDGSLFAIGGNTTSSIQSSMASVQKADITTSISEVTNISLLQVYPNPTHSFLNMNMNFQTIKIFDIQGKEIRRFTNVNYVDISKLKEGVYFLRGNIGEHLYQAKFIKI